MQQTACCRSAQPTTSARTALDSGPVPEEDAMGIPTPTLDTANVEAGDVH